jgi:hypothetical protein
LGGLSIKSLLPAAASGFFVFIFQRSKLASDENKKSLALRAQGFYWGRWRIRTAVNGFADRYLTTRLTDRVYHTFGGDVPIVWTAKIIKIE